MVYPDAPIEANKQDARLWLQVFTELVKENSRGCNNCATEWDKLLKKCPISLENKVTFYHWTLAAHDWINKHLGKALVYPEISLTHPLFL